METNDKNVGSDFFEKTWEQSWTYIRSVADVVREPILILDKDLRVMAANESFYHMFQVEPKDTEKKIVYELGNGQWDIPALRKLLEDILPKNTFFKGFEVSHRFPIVGDKIMILNARQIHTKEDTGSGKFPSIILLAMEDITDIMAVAEKFAAHANKFDTKFTEQTETMTAHIGKLEREIEELKRR